MKEDRYFHTILKETREDSLIIFKEICESKKILPPSKQKIVYYDGGCNSVDEICLSKDSDTYLSLNQRSSFLEYTDKGITFVLKGNIPNIYQPEVISFDVIDFNIFKGLTDFYDEYRTKEKISLDELEEISIPLTSLMYSANIMTYLDKEYENIYDIKYSFTSDEIEEIARRLYDDVKTIMTNNNINVPITDGIDGPKIKKREDIKRRY